MLIKKKMYNWAIGLMSRVFANGPGRPGFNPKSSHTKDSKDGTWLRLNTQHYKVQAKSNVEQSREWSSALPYTTG